MALPPFPALPALPALPPPAALAPALVPVLAAAVVLIRRLRPTNRVRRAVTTALDVHAWFSPPVKVSAATLQRRALRRMLEHATRGVTGSVLVPGEYTVHLAPADYDLVLSVKDWFCQELADGLRRETQRLRWRCPRLVWIQLAVRDEQPGGTPGVDAVYDPPTPDRTPDEWVTEELPSLARTEPPVLFGPDGTYLVQPGTFIGRSATCTVSVADESVSRYHCRIDRDSAGWFVEDLGSRNGTRVAGRPVHGRQRLADGDVLQVGGSLALRFSISRDRITERKPDLPVRRSARAVGSGWG